MVRTSKLYVELNRGHRGPGANPGLFSGGFTISKRRCTTM